MRSRLFPIFIAILTATSFAAVPVRGFDDEKDKKAEKKKEEKKKVDPIKRLVEIKIDPFLVPARALNVPLPGRIKTSQELLERLEKLGKDDAVGAILLNLQGLTLSIPDIEEVRSGLTAFRKTGKKVKAFLNSGDPNSYLLACSADEIAIAPSGNLAVPGLGSLYPFMRGMYQLQGIEYDVITAGDYKYPGFYNRREPNKFFLEEFGEILDSQFEDYVRIIAEGRDLSPAKVRDLIDTALFGAEDAKNSDLVDVISYYEDYRDRILRREKFKKDRGSDSGLARVTSLQDLLSQITREMKKAQERYKAVGPKIAILHARGPIVDADLGGGLLASTMIMREPFVKTIEEIRKNKTIRAVVLHIDSPGGSAYASDVIWRKLTELDEEKPLVVSMGTVAGSGGYYIAAPGRLIFAQPQTLTGSIGVLAILANQASRLNRMDVNLHEMKRGKRALLGAGHRDMTPQDRKLIQDFILRTYDQFLDRVASGRKMPKKEVRKIAGGRIYTGRRALELGLVDRLGGLNDAVAAVREIANIPASAEIKLVHYPRPSSLGELAESLFGLSALMNAATLAQTPAMPLSFDQQLRFFAREINPLCWMAIPNVAGLGVPGYKPAPPAQSPSRLDRLGLPQFGPFDPIKPPALIHAP
ncbi:MAG: signal peptide peptidase SppA [Phycisphaerae bacterium]